MTRFEFKLKVNFIDEETGEEIYHKVLIDNSNGNEIGFDDMVGLLNTLHEENISLDGENARLLSKRIEDLEQFEECVNKAKQLKEENEQLRQKIKHWVYVDVDNEKGCMNCKYDIGSICSILDCGTHDYLMGVSECGLKYWEYKDE